MSADVIEQLSDALADRVAAAGCVVAVGRGHRHVSGILWQPDVVVTSEQLLGERDAFTVALGGTTVAARLAGRDPGTNVAVLRLEAKLEGALPEAAPTPRAGSLALVLGADAAGAPTGRLAMLHAVGAEWHSQAGGRIDALLRLDVRLGADEGGPVLTPGGKLLGMSTSGPRRRALVIPAATISRVLPSLLASGPCRARLAGRGAAARCGAGKLARRGRVRGRHDGGQPGRRRAGRAGGGAAGRSGAGGRWHAGAARARPGGGAGAGTDRPAGRAAPAAGRRAAHAERADHRAAGALRPPSLRVRLHVADAARRQELTALLEASGHVVAEEAPDVVLCDIAPGVAVPGEAEAPVIVLTNRAPPGDPPAGILGREVSARQLDLAVRAVAAGLLVRAPGLPQAGGFGAAEEVPPLTPRETEILTRVGEGMSNKAIARRLGISVHTVKFHLEALFAKLEATSRAEAVAKGLRGGILEI